MNLKHSHTDSPRHTRLKPLCQAIALIALLLAASVLLILRPGE